MNKNILQFLMPFIPILAYIIIDSFINNETISIIVAIAIGLVEFIYTFLKEKKVDFFIIVDIIILILFGLISIIFKNNIFFLIKPAFFEIIIFLLILIFIIKPSFFKNYISRYLKTPLNINENYIRNMLIYFNSIIFIHIVLIFYSAFFLDKKIWAFISSFLLFILLIFPLLIWGILKKIIYKFKFINSEFFDILDEYGRIIGKAPREICHNGSKLLHPVVHIHFFNPEEEKLLLQKRSMKKDIQPGKWDTSVGGHISSGETLESAIIRETKEELGININLKNLKRIANYIFESNIEKEFVSSYIYLTDMPITDFSFQKEEIDEIKYFSPKEIKKLIYENKTTENFKFEFENILNKFIKN